MLVLTTLGLLVLSAVALVVIRTVRPTASYPWLVAALGALLAWGSVLAWQLELPYSFSPSLWLPLTLFGSSPLFLAESYSWLYALSLVALTAAVILTTPAHIQKSTPASWAGTLVLTALGLLAVLADNILTLALVWTAIDLTEVVNTLRTVREPNLAERAVLSFSIRSVGTGFALWAGVVGGEPFTLETAPVKAGLLILIAVGLRLGVLPLHLTYRSEPSLRRGFGTSLRLTAAASSLVVLTRLPTDVIEARWQPWLLAFTAFAALYGGWKWFFARDELGGRPYWLIGMGALSLAAALRGNPTGSAAWGAALLLFGGLSFLYSVKQVWLSRLLGLAALLALGLPFTLTATGWQGTFPYRFVFWPLFFMAHALLGAGFVRHLLHPDETKWNELLRWAQAAYPAGLLVLIISAILGSLWGWPGALAPGLWIPGLIAFLLNGLAAVAVLRLSAQLPVESATPAAPRRWGFSAFQEGLAALFWWLYRLAGRLLAYISLLLEGDGGLLWTFLLLVLLASFVRGR